MSCPGLPSEPEALCDRSQQCSPHIIGGCTDPAHVAFLPASNYGREYSISIRKNVWERTDLLEGKNKPMAWHVTWILELF